MIVQRALELLHVPTQVRVARAEPMPRDVSVLLRIAAGDDAAIEEAVTATGRERGLVLRAAEFYIEQVLLMPDADSYRVLGVQSDAPRSDLQRNMRLLMKWLHPDVARNGERGEALTRVSAAWNDVRTAGGRRAYDAVLARKLANGSGKMRNARSRRGGRQRVRRRPARRGVLARLSDLIFGGRQP